METFSSIFKKDSFRIILTLVACLDLKLQQMDIKTTFLNENIEKEVYMEQLKGFCYNDSEHLVYKLKKSICDLK